MFAGDPLRRAQRMVALVPQLSLRHGCPLKLQSPITSPQRVRAQINYHQSPSDTSHNGTSVSMGPVLRPSLMPTATQLPTVHHRETTHERSGNLGVPRVNYWLTQDLSPYPFPGLGSPGFFWWTKHSGLTGVLCWVQISAASL